MEINLSKLIDKIIEVVFDTLSFSKRLSPQEYCITVKFNIKVRDFPNSIFSDFKIFNLEQPITNRKILYNEIFQFVDKRFEFYKQDTLFEQVVQMEFHLSKKDEVLKCFL